MVVELGRLSDSWGGIGVGVFIPYLIQLNVWIIPYLIQLNVWILPKMIHSIFDSILLYTKFNSKNSSIQKSTTDSNQKIIQFISQGIINNGLLVKVPKSVRNRQEKGGFSSKIANIDSKYDSFIHFTIKFNLKNY